MIIYESDQITGEKKQNKNSKNGQIKHKETRQTDKIEHESHCPSPSIGEIGASVIRHYPSQYTSEETCTRR